MGLGKTLQLQGRLNEAFDAYNEALRLNPEMTEAVINLGQTNHSPRALDKVIASLQKANLKNPANVPASILLAAAYQTRIGLSLRNVCWKMYSSKNPQMLTLCSNLRWQRRN